MMMKKSLWVLVVLLSHTLCAQNVGIGTTTPQSTFDVKGNQRIGGATSYMTFDTLSGKIVWSNANLFVPVTQALMKHSAAADGLFYNNSGGTTGQMEYRNALGEPVFFTNFTNGNGYFKSRLGIGTVSPLAGLHVADSSVLFSAAGLALSMPGNTPITGAGRRMMWYADKAAFRAGYVSADQWDKVNIGNYSFSAGFNSKASGYNSISIGNNTNATGIIATALGNQSIASGNVSTATGDYTSATGDYATAMGQGTTATGYASVSIGHTNLASGIFALAFGKSTKASGESSTAMGESTKAIGIRTTAMGLSSTASGHISTALGYATIAKGHSSTVLGIFNDSILLADELSISTTSPIFIIGNGDSNTARTNALVVLKNGNMGIGISNPGFPQNFANTFGDKISFKGNSGPHYGIGVASNLMQIHTDGLSSDVAFGFGTSGAFTETVRIKGNGKVGIGIAAPLSPLSFGQLLGDKISLWSNSSNSYGFGIQSGLLQIHTDVPYADIAFGYGSSDVMTERMRIVNSGSIGMELSGRIYLKNGSSPLNPDDSPGLWLYNSDNSELLGFMGTQNSQNIGFYGGPGGWGFVYNALNSRVGIGTSNPASPLDVTGNTLITGSFISTSTSLEGIGLLGNCQTTLSYGTGVYGVGGNIGVYGEAIQVGVGERVGVSGWAFGGDANYGTEGFAQSSDGTTATGIYGYAGGSGTNWAGYFSGAVYATSYSSSDRKLKQDIHSLDNAMSIIQQLHPTLYTYKTNEYKQMQLPEGTHYGLIADEVQQVIPGIVKKAVQPAQYEHHGKNKGQKLSDEVEFNAVNYTEIISILVGAVKEQQKEIDELKLQVAELMKK